MVKLNFDVKTHILKNGLEVITIKKNTQISSINIGIKVGALNESLEEKGISHYIEHMIFKGTKNRTFQKLNDEPLMLSPKEFELLVYLSDNIGIALSRDIILDNVWGIDYYGDLRTVDTNIKRLREKLASKSNYIITVRGSGYKFEIPNEQ